MFLPFQKGEVLKIIKKTADGWWLAQDKIGNRGVVPKTYLKVLQKSGKPQLFKFHQHLTENLNSKLYQEN